MCSLLLVTTSFNPELRGLTSPWFFFKDARFMLFLEPSLVPPFRNEDFEHSAQQPQFSAHVVSQAPIWAFLALSLCDFFLSLFY